MYGHLLPEHLSTTMLFSLSTALMRGHLVQHQRGIIVLELGVLKAFTIFAQFEGTHILASPNCDIFAICGGKFFMTHTCGGNDPHIFICPPSFKVLGGDEGACLGILRLY